MQVYWTYNLWVRVMRQLSEEERKIIVKFYLQTGSLVLTQRKFRTRFPTIREKPPSNTIKRLTEHFLAHGTVGTQNTRNSSSKILPEHLWKSDKSFGELRKSLECPCDTLRSKLESAAVPRIGFFGRTWSLGHTGYQHRKSFPSLIAYNGCSFAVGF